MRRWGIGAAAAVLVAAACTSIGGLTGGSDGSDGGQDAGADAADATCAADLSSDPLNCGTCGITCGTKASCVAGRCLCGGQGGDVCTTQTPAGCDGGPCTGQVVGECSTSYTCKTRRTLAVLGSVKQLIATDTTLYIAEDEMNDVGGVYSVPIGGGALTHIAKGSTRGIALADGNVFFTDATANTIGKCPVSGCPSDAAPFAQAGDVPLTIAVFGGRVYWSALDDNLHTCADPCVTPTSTPVGGFGRIVGNAVAAWMPTSIANTIDVVPFDTSLPQAIYTGQQDPFDMTINGSGIYWASLDSIRAGSFDGGADASVLVTGDFGVTTMHSTGIAADDSYVYWTHPTGVLRCKTSGCNGTAEIVTAFPAEWGLAVDATHVFFAHDGAVYRADK